MIVPYTEVKVTRVDENKNELYDLSLKSVGALLGLEDYSLDIDRGLFMFSPQNIGNLFKITYYSEDIINPFKISENLFQLAETVVEWTRMRITHGMNFYRTDCNDEEYILHFERGGFVYNGEYYSSLEKAYDFRGMAVPTVQDKYRGYMFYIDEDTLQHPSKLYAPYNMLTEPDYLYTNSLYDYMYHAKSELLGRYESWKPNSTPLIVAFIYLKVDTNYHFWIEYPKESRGIKLKF